MNPYSQTARNSLARAGAIAAGAHSFGTNMSAFPVHVGACRICGCTEHNCTQCVKRTGSPCRWIAPNLCSACSDDVAKHVYMLKPRFAALVRTDRKYQTIRGLRKRMPLIGDMADLREWEARPYHSKQILIRTERITRIDFIRIGEDGQLFLAGDQVRTPIDLDAFAIADGFRSYAELKAFIYAEHGLPFSGFVTYWGK